MSGAEHPERPAGTPSSPGPSSTGSSTGSSSAGSSTGSSSAPSGSTAAGASSSTPPSVPPRTPSDAEAADRTGAGTGASDRAEHRTKRRIDWRHVGKRALVWLVLAALAFLVALVLAQVIPRWWGQVVGDLVNGTLSLGVWWGLFFGAVFTGLPLAVAWQAARPRRPWSLRITFLVVALVLAMPNLFTLSVVLGTNEAAQAGERILDVEAPAFRAATAWGAGIGAVAVIAILVLWAGYRRRGRELRQLRDGEH